ARPKKSRALPGFLKSITEASWLYFRTRIEVERIAEDDVFRVHAPIDVAEQGQGEVDLVEDGTVQRRLHEQVRESIGMEMRYRRTGLNRVRREHAHASVLGAGQGPAGIDTQGRIDAGRRQIGDDRISQ